MLNLAIFYNNLATVGLIILLGFILGRKKWLNENTSKQLTNILLSIIMPVALFTAFPRKFHHESLIDFLLGLGGGLTIFVVLIIASKLLFRPNKLKGKANYHQFAFIFNNASFLGYPLVQALFGDEMMMAYCGFNMMFNISLFSYGVFLFEKKITKKSLKNIFLNPNIVVVLFGFILFIVPFEIELPQFMDSFLTYIGAIMTPLSLICIGYLLSKADYKNIFKKKRLFITCGLQLTLGPVLTLLVVSILGLPPHIKVMLVLLQSLPTATTLGLFAEKYGKDTDEASEIVMVSTILSIITLPIMSLVINSIS